MRLKPTSCMDRTKYQQGSKILRTLPLNFFPSTRPGLRSIRPNVVVRQIDVDHGLVDLESVCKVLADALNQADCSIQLVKSKVAMYLQKSLIAAGSTDNQISLRSTSKKTWRTVGKVSKSIRPSPPHLQRSCHAR